MASLALAARQAPAAAQYNLVQLDTNGLGTGEAYAIDHGVAGGGIFGDAGIWTTPGHFTDLAPAGYTSSGVFGISGNQQVGVAYDRQHQQHAVLWTDTAASVVNLSPTPSTVCYATATDGAQQVGVIAGPTAALWTGTGASFVSLNPPNFLESTATGVANGVRVGYGRYFAGEVALSWRGSANSFTILRAGAQALGIAPSGQIAGLVGNNGTNEAALWTDGTSTSFVDIAPPNTTASELTATNGVHQVGDVSFEFGGATLPLDHHPAVWTGNASSVQLLPMPQGYNYGFATGIDGQGDISGYVGVQISGSIGDFIPVIWQPVPEPSTLALLGVGVGVLRRRRMITSLSPCRECPRTRSSGHTH